MLVAFACTEEDDGTGGIYFGETNLEARKAFANAHHGGEMGGLHVYRAEWADSYADKPVVPAWLMIANGWWFDCSGCGERIDEDFLYDNTRPLAGVIGSQWASVYCCRKCYRRETRRRGRAKAREAAAIEDLKQCVRVRFGDVVFSHTHAYCPEGERGAWHVQQVRVCFAYPGAKYGPAQLEYRAPESGRGRLIGPPALEYSVPSGDVATFETWATATKRAA